MPLMPSGAYVPLITPFDSHNRIDFDSLTRLIKWLSKYPLAGLVVAGTTGEGHLLSVTEKKQLFKFCADLCRHAAPHFALVACTGTQKLSEATELVDYASLFSYKAVLALPPKTNNQKKIEEFYQSLSYHKLPLLAYNIPKLSHSSLSPETMLRLYTKKISFGLKDSSQDPELLLKWKRFCPKALLIVGEDKLISIGIDKAGADATIAGSANIAPQLVCDLFLSAKSSKGYSSQEKLSRLVDVLLSTDSFVGSVKTILHNKGIISFSAKRALGEINGIQKTELLRKVKELGFD